MRVTFPPHLSSVKIQADDGSIIPFYHLPSFLWRILKESLQDQSGLLTVKVVGKKRGICVTCTLPITAFETPSSDEIRAAAAAPTAAE